MEAGFIAFRTGRSCVIQDRRPWERVVRTLYQDGEGVLWIGTDAGVTRLKADKFFTFSTREGMWDDVISRIIDDGLLPAEGGQAFGLAAIAASFVWPGRLSMNWRPAPARHSIRSFMDGLGHGLSGMRRGIRPGRTGRAPDADPGMENARLG